MNSVPAETPRESADEFAARAHRLHRRRMRRIVAALLGGACLLLLLCGGGAWYGIHRARLAGQEREFQNQLMMTGLAAHGFHTAQGRFPPLPADDEETPETEAPLSFQTALLPHLGQGSVFRMIDKTVPWDADPTGAYELPLAVFLSPKHEMEKTADGHGATFIVPNERMMPAGVGLSMSEVADGTAHTIMAGGIDETSVPAWGDPNNGRDPAKGFGGGTNAFGGYTGGGALVLLGDGNVKTVSENIDPKVAKALATPAGGDLAGNY